MRRTDSWRSCRHYEKIWMIITSGSIRSRKTLSRLRGPSRDVMTGAISSMSSYRLDWSELRS